MSNQSQLKKTQKSLNSYARYSGLVFQMGAIIFGGTFGGIKLDELLHTKKPLFTVTLSFISVVLAIYFAIKDFIHPKK